MKVKIVLKHTNRVAAIKELRALTGFGLKQACDLIPGGASWNDSFVIELISFPLNVNKYTEFDIIKLEKNTALDDELKNLICRAVRDNQLSIAKELIDVLNREQQRKSW